MSWIPSQTTFIVNASGFNQTNITSSTTTLNSTSLPLKIIELSSPASTFTLIVEIRDNNGTLTSDNMQPFLNNTGGGTNFQYTPSILSTGRYEFTGIPVFSGTYYLGTIAGQYIFMAFDIRTSVVPCFFGNAPVRTPFGNKRIDSLRNGDIIISSKGHAPIKNLRSYSIAASKTSNPYLIPKGTYSASEDVLISPLHAVVVDGKLVPAKDLGLVQENLTGTLTYFNIELDKWDNMFVADVEVETLAPAAWVILNGTK